LASAVLPLRKTAARIAPRSEPFKSAIAEVLRSDLDAPTPLLSHAQLPHPWSVKDQPKQV
jgi:hypothetical protein